MRARCHPKTTSRKGRFLLLAGILFIAGCSAESELARLDPSLTETDLRQGKVAVLGVVKFQEPDQIRPPLIAMLESTWREERRDVPLIPADSVRQILGPERDRKLLLEFEYQGSLDAPGLSEISESLRGVARYLITARVDKDRTRNSTRGISTTDTTSAQHVLYAMGVTGRDARVTVQLYDLSRRALVMSGRFEGSAESEHPMLSPLGQVSFVPRVPPEEQGYPETPELALALQEPFRNFARILPGSTKAPSSPPVEKK